ELFPGHVAGSLCGAAMSSRVSSTIGFERRFNPPLRLAPEGAFVGEAVGGAPLRAPDMGRSVALHPGPVPRPPASPHPLSPARAGREMGAFAAGPAHGATNVPGDGSSFATKSGFLLSVDEPIIVHAESEEQAERAARGLRSVGLLELAGYTIADGDDRLSPIEL